MNRKAVMLGALLCAALCTGCSSDRGLAGESSSTEDIGLISEAEQSSEPEEESRIAESSEESLPDASVDSDAVSGESTEPVETAPPAQGSGTAAELYSYRDYTHWDTQVEDGASAIVSVPEPGHDSLYIDAYKSGPNPWSVQAKYLDIALQEGTRYRVSFAYQTQTYNEGAGYDSGSHSLLLSFIQNYDPFDPYFETTLKLNQKEFTDFSAEFVMDHASDSNVFCGFSFGGLGDVSVRAEIRDFKIEQIG